MKFPDFTKPLILKKDIFLGETEDLQNNILQYDWRTRHSLETAISLNKDELVSADKKFFKIPAGTQVVFKILVWRESVAKFEISVIFLNPLFKGIEYKSVGKICWGDYTRIPVGESSMISIFEFEET